MLPGPGIDALLAAGVALDLSKKARTGEAISTGGASNQQKHSVHALGLAKSVANALGSGCGLPLQQGHTKGLRPSPVLQGRASAAGVPAAVELISDDVEERPSISRPHPPPVITLQANGLPVLPDLEAISTGPAGVVRILLQVP
jgi:hypothetical protein